MCPFPADRRSEHHSAVHDNLGNLEEGHIEGFFCVDRDLEAFVTLFDDCALSGNIECRHGRMQNAE